MEGFLQEEEKRRKEIIEFGWSSIFMLKFRRRELNR